MSRDESDLNSPERQRANIQAECDRRGWIAEWIEVELAGKHNSV